MKATGIVRHVDSLGRVVLPKELRSTMDIAEHTPLEIYSDGDKIVLKKYAPGCVFTGQEDDLILFKGKLVSKAAIEEMAAAAGLSE